MTQAIQIARPPETDEELYELVKFLWDVTIPNTHVCPNHCTPFEAFADAYFARSPVAVWKASRGFGGKSRTLAYLTMTEAVTIGADVNLLGGSGAQSMNVHEAMQQGWSSTVGNAIYENMVMNDTRNYTRLNNGAKIKALMASQRSVRGPHPQRLRMDEIDEMEVDILDAAMGQTMEDRGIPPHTVLSSTHQYADKTMTEMLKRSTQKGWPVFEWCWRETSNDVDGWLTNRMIKRKQQEVTKYMWEVEYDLQEPAVGNRAFDTKAVEAMFDSDEIYKHHSVEKGEFYDFEEPNSKHGEYVTGADWAKERDYTVIVTLRVDCDPARVVAYKRLRRKPYPLMIKLFNEQLEKFPGAAIHDATGLGNVVDDYIDQRATGFIMSGRARDDMLSEYVNAVEQGKVSSPKIETAYTAHKYCTVEDMYGRGQSVHLPDEVCAFALAWHICERRVGVTVPSIDIVNDGSYWKAMG